MGKIIVVNFKMNGSKSFYADLQSKIKNINTKDTKLILCPPFVYLPFFKKKSYTLGAQDISNQDNKASTGQIAPSSLKEFGVEFVLVGHSDRRKLGESLSQIQQKISLALKYDIVPIICIGERSKTLRLASLRAELQTLLKDVNKRLGVVIAYEPVWAISSGQSATVERIDKVYDMIKTLTKELGIRSKVLYGGSLNKSNFSALSRSKVDGFVVGNQALDVDGLIDMLNSADFG